MAVVAVVSLGSLLTSSRLALPAVGGTAQVRTLGAGAWCWFADPRAVYFDGRTYVAWMDSDDYDVVAALSGSGSIMRARIARLGSSTVHDDHDVPALLIEPDGRITAFYSQHSGPHMYMRTTLRPLDITAWGPQQTIPANPPGINGYTYPNPQYLSAEKKTYLFWRGGATPTYAVRDASGAWSQAQALIGEPGEDPYVKVASNGRDTIYLAFTDAHPRGHLPGIFFAEYREGLLRHADGTPIGIPGSPVIRPAQADHVYDSGASHIGAWVDDVAVMPDGSPVILFTTFPDAGRRHEYHYARWDGRTWRTYGLGDGGGTITTTASEHFYSGGMDLDAQDPRILYASVGPFGHHRIERLSTTDGGRSWRRTWITSAETDNVRPVVPRGLPSGSSEVLWMRGFYGAFGAPGTSIVGEL